MPIAEAIRSFRRARVFYFESRSTLAWPAKLALAFGMAAFTGLCAQLVIPLEPVPITGQVFGVLLAGALLGGGYGAMSQLIYVAAGSAGVPWFHRATSGFPGLTGGYLLGFAAAAYVVGTLTERHEGCRTLGGMVGAMSLGIAVILACGAAQFALVTGYDLRMTFAFAVAPFILIDLGKAVLAAAIARGMLPGPR